MFTRPDHPSEIIEGDIERSLLRHFSICHQAIRTEMNHPALEDVATCVMSSNPLHALRSRVMSRIANAREWQRRINFLLLDTGRRVNRILFELIVLIVIPAIPRTVSGIYFTQDFTSSRIVKSRHVEHNLLSYPRILNDVKRNKKLFRYWNLGK